MTSRYEAGTNWTQTFNEEGRLSQISDGSDTWTFTYDGDGVRVMQDNPDGTTTLFLGGGSYEVHIDGQTTTMKKYYAVAGQRVMRDSSGDLHYMLTDHLGSVAAVLDESGSLESDERYMPFGGLRDSTGIAVTDFAFTGQRNLAEVGLIDYNARWYSPSLSRFISADTMVLNRFNSQALNRYSYVYNAPINYNDPSGHWIVDYTDEEHLGPYAPPTTESGFCDGDDEGGGGAGDDDKIPDGCYLIPVGVWHVTQYVYATPRGAKGKTVTITVGYDDGSGRKPEKIKVPIDFLYGANGIAMQGTGIYNGRPIHAGNFRGKWIRKKNGELFFQGKAKFYWGWGNPGYEMTPLQHAAVGRSFVGRTFFIPFLDKLGVTYKVPGLTGVVEAVDRGGWIVDGDIDVFVGHGPYSAWKVRDMTQEKWKNPIDTEVYEIFCPPRNIPEP